MSNSILRQHIALPLWSNFMKKILLLVLPLLLSGCARTTSSSSSEESKSEASSTPVSSEEESTSSVLSSSEPVHEHDYQLVVTKEAKWHTFVAGKDFDDTGLEVALKCRTCGEKTVVEYTLEDNENLTLDQESVTINYQNYSLAYEIKVKEKYHIACVGDSLTAGHYWANESYPTKLSAIVDDRYQVENCGVNGISITGYGGSWDDPEMRYIKQDVYAKSVNFAPDIIAIMLGTNDATGWAKAEPTFYDEYCVLLDSYLELFPDAQFIMMVSPPTKDGNQFGIPNTTIKEEVNPIQRQLADEYGFEVLDLREEFEANANYESEYLRPNNDGVHFTVAAAEYVASRVWEIAQDLRF